MIHAENVSRRYGNNVAVDSASFEISHGQIVGLLGRNGAGKTTIMKMLTGFLEPSLGTITINGISITDAPELVQGSIGYLPESLPVYPEMTVIDYLTYCAQMRNIEHSKIDLSIKNVLEKTQLLDKALHSISTLSRGYKQRVGVAQALIHSPKIIILDEPTNGLDPQQTASMRKLILELAKTSTVILSTHIMQEVDAICDRVIILESGRVVIDENLDALRKSNNITLSSDINLEVLCAMCADAHEVIEPSEGHFHIKLTQGTNSDEYCADLATKLVAANHKIFAISPEQRDLEVVFRNIHEEKELNNAA